MEFQDSAPEDTTQQVIAQEANADRSREKEQKPLEKGDIFYTSWGYDQTQNDFIEVLEVSLTGKTCKCRMVGKEDAGEQTVRPSSWRGDKVFRMKVDPYQGELHLRGTYPFCDGDTRFDSFWPYTQPVYETPLGMEH